MAFLDAPESRRKVTMAALVALALPWLPFETLKVSAREIADTVLVGPITVGTVVAALALYITYLIYKGYS